MARGGFAMLGTQRFEQIGQTVMVDLLHQRQQATDLARWKTDTGEPVEVIARQIGDQRALVFAKRHAGRHQALQVFGLHQR